MKNNFFSSIITVAAFFILFFLPSPAQAANYTLLQLDYNGYLATQTLTRDKSPYLVLSGCARNNLKEGRTLTIEAGTIVKFADNKPCGWWGTIHAGLYIYGNLIVNGTPEEPVIFTSYRDDTSSGDTNNDGNTTAPNKGDWKKIALDTKLGNISIKNAIFRYGGQGSALMTISNKTIPPIGKFVI